MLIQTQSSVRGSAIANCPEQPLPYDPNQWLELTVGVTAPDTIAGKSSVPVEAENEVTNHMKEKDDPKHVEFVCYPRFPGHFDHYATIKTTITINKSMMKEHCGCFQTFQDDNKITIRLLKENFNDETIHVSMNTIQEMKQNKEEKEKKTISN